MSYSIENNRGRKTNILELLAVCFYFFIAFFEPYLNNMIGSVTKYYIIALIGILLLFNNKYRIKGTQIIYALWLAYKMLSVFWAGDTSVAQLHFFSQVGMIGLLIVLTSVEFSKRDIDAIILTELIGSSIIGVLSLFFSQPYHGINEARQVLVLFGNESDPNNIAAFLCIGSIIAFYYLITGRKYRLICALMFIVNTYSCLQTGSRAGLITIVVSCVLVFLFCSSYKKMSTRIRFFVVFAALLALLYFIITRFLPDVIYMRLFDYQSYEGGSERTDIWKTVWELCLEDLNLIFGAGWGAYHGYNGMDAAVHNTFLSMLSDVGLIGCTLFFAPIAWRSIFYLKRRMYLPLFLLAAAFVPSFFLEAINKRFFWNAIMIFFMYINVYSDYESGIRESNI